MTHKNAFDIYSLNLCDKFMMQVKTPFIYNIKSSMNHAYKISVKSFLYNVIYMMWCTEVYEI